MNKVTCPLCDSEQQAAEYFPEQNVGLKVFCENCRGFIVSPDGLSQIKGSYRNHRHVLSQLSRDRHSKGLPPLEITSESIEELLNPR
jgi:hypothetical protein